ncbi:hypothetical protein D3C75_741570 [compost metagenome]
MSQQDIFKKAIAAKLSGDEEGFKAAISEAIKSKAKAMLSESMRRSSAAFYRDQQNRVEQVADKSYLFDGPIDLPEGVAPNVPAGQYSVVVDIDCDNDADSAWAYATMVQIFPMGDDTVLAELHGQEADHFAQQFLEGKGFEGISDYASEAYMDDVRERAAENDWEGRTGAW